MTDWTKADSRKAAAVLESAAQQMIALGMASVGPWRMMLIHGIDHLAQMLEPDELLDHIRRTRNWLDVLEREAKSKGNGNGREA